MKKVTVKADDEEGKGGKKEKRISKNVPRKEKDSEDEAEWHRVSGKKSAMVTVRYYHPIDKLLRNYKL